METATNDRRQSYGNQKNHQEFSLIGILSEIAAVLADHNIPIFAVSTYNTDYLLVKKENYEKAIQALEAAGYKIIEWE